MPEVQIGTTSLPILVSPRINGLLVTQTQIKNDFSNEFISDSLTPIAFTLEWKTRDSTTPTPIAWNASKSTESKIFFPMPDSFWANINTYTIMVFWTIATEKIFTDEPTQIAVKDLHKGV